MNYEIFQLTVLTGVLLGVAIGTCARALMYQAVLRWTCGAVALVACIALALAAPYVAMMYLAPAMFGHSLYSGAAAGGIFVGNLIAGAIHLICLWWTDFGADDERAGT